MARPVIYFGSSFNPITVAHLAMLEHLIKETSNEIPRPIIMLAPVFKHVFSKSDLIDYEPRMKKTQKAVDYLIKKLNFEGIEVHPSDVFVSDIDQVVYEHERNKLIASELTRVGGDESKLEADWRDKLKVSAGSWKVTQYILEHTQELGIDPKQFRMVFGNDTYEDIMSGLWYDELKIFDACQRMYVFDRDKKPILSPKEIVQKVKQAYEQKKIELEANEFELKKLEEAWPNRLKKMAAIDQYWDDHILDFHEKFQRCVNVIPEAYRDVSSTKARQFFEEAKKYLVAPVLDFIIENKLYEWAKHMNDAKKPTVGRKD